MVCIEGSAFAVATSVASAYLRQCVAEICHGRNRRNRVSSCTGQDREDFEDLIGFLAAVPLFQKQLPKSELPKVASALKLTTWAPGARVIEQGKEGKAFFILRAGEASVVVKSSEGERVRATLYHGDYFGGHTLTQKRPNIATIVAKGPAPLVTLSMSREEFERLGLHKELKFPKRPAIYDGRIIEDGQRMADLGANPAGNASPPEERDLTKEEESFICRVIRENPNLRARVDLDSDIARKMARAARRRHICKGGDILQGGELAREFFVISSGSFQLIPRVLSGKDHQSVEAMVASTAATERLGRKQQFLMGMVQGGSVGSSFSPKPQLAGLGKHGRSQSTRIPTLAASVALRRHSGVLSPSGRTPFKAGDAVVRLVVGQGFTSREVGHVVEVLVAGPDGEVAVEFPDPQGRQDVLVRYLRPAAAAHPVATLHSGDCCGEVELLYNTRQMATSRALEDSLVYAIDHWTFKECFRRESPHFKDSCRLLNEVHMLTPLLLSERVELARNSTGLMSFAAGERVLQQGEARAEKLWYVVEKGSCRAVQNADGPDGNEVCEELRQFHRAEHFGANLMAGSTAGEIQVPNFSVDAGPEGVTCLVLDGEILRNLCLSSDGQNSNLFEVYPRVQQVSSTSAIPLEKLQRVAVLGEGGFGSVFLVKCEEKEYALKRMSKGYIVEANVARQIRAERDIFSMVDSAFIVRFFRSYQDEQYVYMLMEFASGGHLWGMMCENWNVLQKDNPRGSATMFYIACVSLAFDHLHERHIVYRDLKPENILLDGRGYAKLCDLGFARFVLTKSNTLVGTPEYMAPEMIDTPHAHDTAVDWWSLGVLTFELITGQAPWDDEAASDTMAQILTIRRGQEQGPPVRLLPAGSVLVKDFIKKLLCVDEEQRMGRKRGGVEVREHPWFAYAGFDFAALQEGTLRSPWQPSQKVIERHLPKDDEELQQDSSLFVHYEGDSTGWEAAF